MPAIGECIDVQDVPYTSNTSLVTEKLWSDIVREFTFENLIQSRQSRPDALGSFSDLSSEELHRELDKYQHFLVEVADGNYRLVIGFADLDARSPDGPTVLYAAS